MCPASGKAAVKAGKVRGRAESLWLLCSCNGKQLSHIEDLNMVVCGLRSDYRIVAKNADLCMELLVKTLSQYISRTAYHARFPECFVAVVSRGNPGLHLIALQRTQHHRPEGSRVSTRGFYH